MSKSTTWVKYENAKEANRGQFIVSPLERGMGNTIGNALRRVLLSSLSGYAITSVRIEGAQHEFATLPNIEEDVMDIIFNIKGVVFERSEEDEVTLTLHKKGKGVVKASDIESDSKITISNRNHHIANLGQGGELKVEMILEKGVGYCPSEIKIGTEKTIDTINVDAFFSPIKRVNHHVEDIRIGKSLDHDKLTMDVWTNGSISCEDAVSEATSKLIERLELFHKINEEPIVEEEAAEGSEEKDLESALELSIDDLELSARSSNCLKRAGIGTVGALVEKDISELIQIKNFGKKSADEINEKLSQFNLALKGTEE
ncbi:MAG: DNA-directed RNA polymerase subunit alpha [Candidatus Marinamargulisbacteria bacterium]